jgi:hypothetical protein
MKRINFFSALLALFILSLTFSCSKDKDDDVKQTPETLQFSKEEIINVLPAALKTSENEHAQDLVDYVKSAVDMSAFFDQLTPPENAQRISSKSGSIQYKWKYMDYAGGSISMYWTYSENSSKNTWSLEIQYNNGPRYKYIDAWQNKDKSAGEIKYNFMWVCAYQSSGTDCQEVYYIYQWNKSSNGTYTFKWFWEAAGYNGYFWQYDLVINPDGSGTLELTSYGEKWYYYQWNAQGHGSVTYYFLGTTTYEW